MIKHMKWFVSILPVILLVFIEMEQTIILWSVLINAIKIIQNTLFIVQKDIVLI